MRTQSVIRSAKLVVACAIALSVLPLTAAGDEPVVNNGVVIGSADLSGMTSSVASETIATTVRTAVNRRIAVKAAGVAFGFSPGPSITLDTPGMLASALAAVPTSSVADPSMLETISIPASYTVNPYRVYAFLNAVAHTVYRAPVNATPVVRYGRIVIRPARYGRKLNVTAARRAVLAAMAPGNAFANRTVIVLPMVSIRPKVLNYQVGLTILIDRSARTLKLFRNATLVKRYSVAVGMPSYPTPLGHWKVMARLYMPSWHNPGSAWAAGMPQFIGPGPTNPLGTRALRLSAPSILIHGTSKDSSIGHAASHGCIRMHRWDVENLYPRIPVGTRVWIIP